jgi:hypothetical protein
MMSYRLPGWRIWYQRITIGVTIGGGSIMLVVALLARDAASPSLLVIGGVWFVAGLSGLWQAARLIREIVIADEHVEFRSPGRNLVIPAGEITEIGWARWDIRHRGFLRIWTPSHGVTKVSSFMQGLPDFLAKLRQINPGIRERG